MQVMDKISSISFVHSSTRDYKETLDRCEQTISEQDIVINSIIANNEKAWQLFGTDAETARAGLGDLLSGFIGGCSAIDLSKLGDNIKTESLAKYVFLHSFAASKCKKGSNASLIGAQLSKLMRKTKTRLMS